VNDSSTKTAAGHFPTFRRMFGWLFSWRAIRRCLFAAACLATLIALFYAEENWRGRHAWGQYRRDLEARGEQLDFRAFIPKPVPDDQNFAATPFIKSWFLKENLASDGNSKLWQDDYMRIGYVSPLNSASKGDRHFVNLVAFGMGFEAVRSGRLKPHQEFNSDKHDPESRAKAAPAVLEGLKASETNLAELRAASRRPYSRYPVVYDLDNPWGILVPHLAPIKGVVQRLRLRACAELAAGHSENALEDVKLMLVTADSLKDEPILVSYLVRLACMEIAIQPVWEGLAEHRWSDSQLQECQSRLQQYDFLADMKRPLDGERAAGILTADLLYRQKYRVGELELFGFDAPDPTGGGVVNLVSRAAPHGWYYQEQLNYCRLYENQLGGTFDATKKRVFPGQIQTRAHELEREIAGGRLGKTLNAVVHHQLLAAMLLPALGNLPLKAAMGQTTTDHAALACALERFRLANGQFPEKLDALVPRFSPQLPNDVITGQSFKYRRTDDGRFLLYSVGWNEKDDGGTPGKMLFDEKQGDWVWRYSAE